MRALSLLSRLAHAHFSPRLSNCSQKLKAFPSSRGVSLTACRYYSYSEESEGATQPSLYNCIYSSTGMKTRSGNGVEIDAVTKTSLGNSGVYEKFCGHCKQPFASDFAMICDGFCRFSFHPDCVNIDNDTYVLINDKPVSDYTKWFCHACLTKLDRLFKSWNKPDDGSKTVSLCERMDSLFEQYREVNQELRDLKQKYSKLQPNKSPKYSSNKQIIYAGDNEQNTEPQKAKELPSKPVSEASLNHVHSVQGDITYSGTVLKSDRQSDETGLVETESSDDGDTNDNFQKVLSRKSKALPSHLKKEGERKLTVASVKKKWVFVSRLDVSVTQEVMEQYLKDYNVTEFACVELKPKFDD
ncbi:hypothetical protein J6590_035121 [Homalodisca vitripennis]|nr:hypothetical protein J6590_035121 [Homalodisca vitripennis]